MSCNARVWYVLLLILVSLVAGAEERVAEKVGAQHSVEQWLTAIDKGEYERSWMEASPSLQQKVGVARWVESMKQARGALGKLKSRKLKMIGEADGGMRVEFRSEYEAAALNEVVVARHAAGTWRPESYELKP